MANNETDRVALLAFKAAIVEDPFGALTSWNHSLHYCHWNGILCSRRHPDRVIRITLTSQGLVGSLSPHVGNLSFLKSIVLSNNSFHGLIPQEMGRLFRLQAIELSNNSFGGAIPTNLSRCSSLESLNLINNNLTGNILVELGSLSKLRALGLSKNKLSGTIPPAIGNLSSLTVLSLAYCNLMCLRVSKILSDKLRRNYLTCPIPSSIGRLHKLQIVSLYNNKLTELPSSLGNLTSLYILYFEENNIHGSIPPSLGDCHSLLELDLSKNNLNGPIPPEILNHLSSSIFLLLGHNALTGSLPSEIGSLKNLEMMDVSYNRLSGPIPNTLSNCLSLERHQLEANSFEGEIPQSLRMLRGLRVLDLSCNNLSGLIPSYLGELQLDMLNLSFNMLQGQVPIQGVFRNSSAISIVGNNDICGGIAELNLPPCSFSNSSKNKLSHLVKVILVVVSVVIFLSLLVIFFIFLQRHHVSKKKASCTPSIMYQFLRVSYAELLKATNGFSEANLIGVGSYASVYKGILDEVQMVVAVKVLNLQTRGASRSFMTECKALRAIRHRNLLKILSACSSVDFNGDEFKALVYEFMANGNLGKWLHQVGVEDHGQAEEPKNLKLIQRLDISTDVASALEYLHCSCESTIIHGDLKPSNVLLDDKMTAHIGDFGLTKIMSIGSRDVAQGQSNSVVIRGTIGYVAPEYGMGDMASTLGDVYSFGILLLEMFTGKKPTDDMFNDDLNLHNFVKNGLPDRVMEIVDPRILLEHNTMWIKDFMVSILRIGIACSMESPRDRMEMGSVVSELNKIKNTYMNQGLNQDLEVGRDCAT
ncbi:probable LRR receptor-like serine/threonine-protein kinase At3g47570 [Camellia sinensis]|uniref:probable LRR receptor-like serine/threonine-protein kinase At3g47570 n=1 Tax=Camellia sinensis TaxID=4442 RepID=UPI0010355E34|nr:probable LRR receptor-like serine/threonine-protein kinase At3g47570 [Camellia sinensis]